MIFLSKCHCRLTNQDERKFEMHFRLFVHSAGGPEQTLLTEVKLRVRRRLYGGAIPVSAAFVLRVFTYKGLKAARWHSSECPGFS